MKQTASRRVSLFYAVPAVLGLEIVKRILRVLVAAFSSDVLYRSSPLPDVLYWVSVGIEMIALGLAVGTVCLAIRNTGRAAALAGLFLGTLVLDGAVAFLIDLWQHNIAGVEELAALNLLLQMVEPATVIAVGFGIALLFESIGKTGGKPLLAAGVTAALYAVARLAAVASDVIAFFRVYRYPTAAEITSMITDGVSVLLLSGVLFFAAAYFAVFLWRRLSERKE